MKPWLEIEEDDEEEEIEEEIEEMKQTTNQFLLFLFVFLLFFSCFSLVFLLFVCLFPMLPKPGPVSRIVPLNSTAQPFAVFAGPSPSPLTVPEYCGS